MAAAVNKGALPLLPMMVGGGSASMWFPWLFVFEELVGRLCLRSGGEAVAAPDLGPFVFRLHPCFSGELSGDAEELVKFVQVMFVRWIFFCASLAGRGGEGRSRWWSAVRFWWCGWWWSSYPSSLFRPALVARGARSRGGAGFVVVDLGGAASAGRRVVAGSGCCGRVRSATLGSVLLRRTAPAAIYELWRRLLPGGK